MEQSFAESMKLRHKLIQLSRYSDSEKKVFAVYPLKLLRNINKSLPCQGVFTMNYDYTAQKAVGMLSRKTDHKNEFRQRFELVSLECFAIRLSG